MASPDSEMIFERLLLQRDLSLLSLFPYLFGFTAARQQNPEGSVEETPDPSAPRDGIILFNPFTPSMVLVGASGIDSPEDGIPPASKASVEAMPAVEDSGDGECAICLEEWEMGRKVVKEMPCKHRFHGECIEKWLGMHGSCPVCRYRMPSDEKAGEKKRDERRVWVSFSLSFGNGSDLSSPANARPDQETES